jgi:hypothetical protein
MQKQFFLTSKARRAIMQLKQTERISAAFASLII